MIKLGLVSAILEELSLTEAIAFAQKHKFNSLELMCWPKQSGDNRRYAGTCHLDVDNIDANAFAEATKAIEISGLGYYPNPLDADPAKSEFYVEHIKKIIRACNSLNVPVMNTFIGRNQNLNMDDNLVLFKKLWQPIIEVAKQEGIKIGIENCPMFFTNDEWPGGKNLAISPAIWDFMFEAFPTPLFGLNYDPSHMVFQQMDEIKPIYHYKDRLHHVHIKDVKVYKEKLDRVGILANPLEYHSPKLPGRGDVRWQEFFTALKEIDYQGHAVIEFEDKDYEGSLETIEEGISIAKSFVDGFLDIQL